MAIPESQLVTWSAQGSITQSASTYQTIYNVLIDANAPYASRTFDIFLQGSYGNHTNIYADSDVDIVMRLTSIHYYDDSLLNPTDKQRFGGTLSSASYDFATFKKQVTSWLTQKFGSRVRAGNKAIYVPGNGSTRRDADVLACVEHRRYRSYTYVGSNDFDDGICFWTSAGTQIVNYPKQHSSNCTAKHQSTTSRFKPNVRILKNMRNAMIRDKYLNDGVAPSYFLEGMLSNVPNPSFVSLYQTTFANEMNWLRQCDPNQLKCANGIHPLLKSGSQVSWNSADFGTFLDAASRYWNGWR